MSLRDRIAVINEAHWEWSVKKGAGCTIPWLDLDACALHHYAHGGAESVPKKLSDNIYPPWLLTGVEGKDVLCLASGGGQQSAVFGLLGARVAVLDLTEGQLEGDRKAAAHYGYKITTIQGDMRDLSRLVDDCFDLVYQGNSMAWVPDAREIYRGVARVLRKGGVYRVDFTNPATEFVDCWRDWDGAGYRITVPYVETARVERPDANGPESMQFRHHMSEIFNGLLEVGLSIERVLDSPHYSRDHSNARPGSWKHSMMYLGGFAVVSRKA
jgi:SAM-dependent methyltransferase